MQGLRTAAEHPVGLFQPVEFVRTGDGFGGPLTSTRSVQKQHKRS